jgi:hypothetical protein
MCGGGPVERKTDTPTHMYMGNGENYKNELLFTSPKVSGDKKIYTKPVS